jgi:HEPN domain-containing protein
METINGYQQFISDAEVYYKTAANGAKNKDKFTNEILYSMISVSMEKYIKGLLIYHQHLATGCTLTSLIREASGYVDFTSELVDEMAYFDMFRYIYSVESYKQIKPCDQDILNMLNTLFIIRTLITNHLSGMDGMR